MYTSRRFIKVRDGARRWTGEFRAKTVTRVANLGQAAQVLKLDLIAQLCEAQRAAAQPKTERQLAFEVEAKVKRAAQRDETEHAMLKYVVQQQAPSFQSLCIADLPKEEQEELRQLEAMNMEARGFARNGASFADYFRRRDLTVHIARCGMGDELYGFALSGAEQAPGKYFMYELHVAKVARNMGIATSLLGLVETRTCRSGRATKPKHVEIELNVHAGNDACAFYTKVGFTYATEADKEESEKNAILVMRRKKTL